MHINFNVFVYLAILFRNLPINNVFVSISALVRFRSSTAPNSRLSSTEASFSAFVRFFLPLDKWCIFWFE